MSNQVWIVLATAVAILLALEVGLRLLFGFGSPLTYITDAEIGYLLAPSQQTRRFGNAIAINQYSMRSPAVEPTRAKTTLRVLMLGDSIVNGGWWTDQTETISALLQTRLQTQLPSRTQPQIAQIEVLNASANSWSPRNELAYLKRFGSFEAQIIVLVINTDDLFGHTPTSIVVGRDRNYPNRKPALALIEVVTRYLIKPQPIPELAAIQSEGGDRVGINLAAIQTIQTIATANDSQLILLITPLLREVTSGSRAYEQEARQRLQDFMQVQQIPWIDFLPLFNQLADPKSIYRDQIHLNSAGHQLVTDKLVPQISVMLDQK